MSKQAKNYPVTFAYGAKDGYFYGPEGKIGPYHRGDDRAMPVGTPVIVNGVTIGLSGATGNVSGPHLHTGKWLGNKDYNPQGQGFTFKSAIVTQIDTVNDDANGFFVRIQGDGYSWVYLHLSKVFVKVGQKLVPPAPPKPEYPKTVRVVSRWGAYVRSQPSTGAKLSGSRFLPYGTIFRVAGVVKGQPVGGNNKWYKSMYGNYVWSGNIK